MSGYQVLVREQRKKTLRHTGNVNARSRIKNSMDKKIKKTVWGFLKILRTSMYDAAFPPQQYIQNNVITI